MPATRLNLTNPLNRRHPLNLGRVAWWYSPNESGWWGGDRWYDLCRRFDGAFADGAGVDTAWTQSPNGPPTPFFGGTGGGDGVNFNCGGATGLSFTDNFTVGIQFRPATVAPIDINGLAGLIGKYQDAGDQTWYLRQHDDEVQFGGSSQLVSGAILSTSTTSRVVVSMRSGTATIYHQGVAVASGAVSISADTSAVVRIGVDFFSSPRFFIGWIEEAFIIDRPWTAGQVKLDRELSLKQYQVDRGPLNFINSRIDRTNDSGQTVNFTTTCNVGGPLLFATPANFTTELGAFASSGGIGDLDAEGTPEFITSVGILTPFAAGEPTLVNLRTDVTVGDTLQASDPALFTTTVECGQSLRTIPNGDRRIISQKRYRR